MLGLGADVRRRLRGGERLAVVTVTAVPGSAPRGVGASMAVTASGEVIGSISGGCVEADVVVLARLALATGVARSARFGISDADAPLAGLACGGQIDVLAYALDPAETATRRALGAEEADEAVTIALALTGPDAGRVLDAAALLAEYPALAADFDRARLLRESRMLRTLPLGDDAAVADSAAAVLALSRAPRARLIIAGAGEHAAALCRVGSAAGFAVTVCDPWETLVTAERFPDASERVVAPPHELLAFLDAADVDLRTAICVLTHDERLDIPALEAALALPVGFVGALGARSTVARRRALLAARGVDDESIDRIRMPLGLDLGGATPEETAIAVLAEIVAARHGGTGAALRDGTGPLHGRADDRESCAAPVALRSTPERSI